jgi:flavin-dependent dehydrogenase
VERDADVVIVGAGPAGAATAILLAEQGLRVVVLDRARFPRPKLCGEYLSPEAGRILDRLGVLKVVDASAAPLRGMRITAPDGTRIVGTYRPIGRWAPYRQHAMAVPRVALDAALADRLRLLPVDFREEARVTDVVLEGRGVVGVEARLEGGRTLSLRAPLVIGADGRASVVAERLGCRSAHALQRMALTTYVAGVADCREHGEVFVDPPDYAILNPLADGRVNVSVVVPLAHVTSHTDRLDLFFYARVKQMPHLARRLTGAERVEPVRAMGPLAFRVAPPRHGGVLLVGDARGFYDPFTGEGVFAALRGAELAAEAATRAVRSGDVSTRALRGYETARCEAFRAKERVVHLLQLVIARRWLANRVAHTLARRPALLDVLMGVIGDFVPPRALASALVQDA